MSSLGEFLSAMVELRKQKAQEQEFNAEAQYKGMEALGSGIGGLMSNYVSGRRQSAKDTMQARMDEMSLALDRQKLNKGDIEDPLANQMRNQANPPRAIAMSPGLQAAADLAPLPGQTSYQDQPINPTVARGGQAGLKNYIDLRKPDDLAAYRQSQIDLKKEREQRIQEKADADRAMDLLTKAPQKYKDDLAAVRHYYADMKVNMASAAGAKDQYTYDKAVEAITGTYATGEKQGFKVSYPQIPIPAFQREAGQALEGQIARKQGQYDALWPWQSGAAIKSDIATKQGQLKALGDYNYQSPGLQPWDLPEEPSLDQYIPPQVAQPGPSQAQQQGPAPSAATQEQTMSVADAQKINPNYKSGMLIRDKSTGQTFRVQ